MPASDSFSDLVGFMNYYVSLYGMVIIAKIKLGVNMLDSILTIILYFMKVY